MMLSLRLCCFLCFWGALGAMKWDALHVKYGFPGTTPLVNAFYDLPVTSDQAKTEGWVVVPKEEGQSVSTWCLPNDPRVCVLYNLNRIVAGLEISMIAADSDGQSPYDISIHGEFQRKVRFNQNIITTRVYIEDPDTLASGGKCSLDDGIGTGLWVQNGDKIENIPTKESDIVAKTNFTLENCVPGMGRHYYYNISEGLQCEDFKPIFLLVNATLGEVHGYGYQTMGKASSTDRAWFEVIPPQVIKPTIPNAPQCLVDWAKNYGVISLHVYFKKEPWTIPCTTK